MRTFYILSLLVAAGFTTTNANLAALQDPQTIRLLQSGGGRGGGKGGPKGGTNSTNNSSTPTTEPPAGEVPKKKPDQENCPPKSEQNGTKQGGHNNKTANSAEPTSPFIFHTQFPDYSTYKFGIPLSLGRKKSPIASQSVSISFNCSNTVFSWSEGSKNPPKFVFDIILFADFLWTYVILPVTILIIHRLAYHFKLFVTGMLVIRLLKFYLGVKFVVLYYLWDLGYFSDTTQKNMFWIDGLVCMVFLLVAHTFRYLLNKFNDEALGLEGVSKKLILVEKTLGCNGIMAWFWCIFRERDLGSRHLCSLEIWRNILSVIILVMFVGLYSYQRGWSRLLSNFVDNYTYWRHGWGESISLPRMDPNLVRKEIEQNNKSLVLYNDIVINMADMTIFHPHQTYLQRFVSTNIAAVFEGEISTLIGQQRHSGEALKLLKQLARCRLSPPVQIKYPRKGVDAFMRQELVKVSDSSLIGEQGFYHVVLRSSEFFYFMIQSPDYLGATITLRHPHLPGCLQVPIANRLLRFRFTVPNTDPKLNCFNNLRRNVGRMEDRLSDQAESQMVPISQTNMVRSKHFPISLTNYDRVTSPSKYSKGKQSNPNDIRSECLGMLSSHSKSEGLNARLSDSHRRELSGETTGWHHGELHLIVDFKGILDSNPIKRLLCNPGLETTLIAEGPYNLPMTKEALVSPGGNVFCIVEATHLPLYADILMELLEPASSLCYSINSSNLPSEMNIPSRRLSGDQLDQFSPKSVSESIPEFVQLAAGSRLRRQSKLQFLVEADTLEQAYCYGMDCLDYVCKVSKSALGKPKSTDLKQPVRGANPDDSSQSSLLLDNPEEDTVIRLSQNTKRLQRHQLSPVLGFPQDTEHKDYDGPVCDSSLFVRSHKDKCSTRCAFSDEGLFEDGVIEASSLSDLIVDSVRKVYLSGSEEFVSRMQAIIPHLPYRSKQLQVLRFV